MTGMLTLVLTTAISLVIVLAVVICEVMRKRRCQIKTLQQRLQHLERRELAASNAARDLDAQLLQLQNSVAHSQRLLMSSLTRTGRLPGATSPASASRDERKLRDLLPLG